MSKAFYTFGIVAAASALTLFNTVGCEVQDCENEQTEEVDGSTPSGEQEEQQEGSCVVFKSTNPCQNRPTTTEMRAWESGQAIDITSFNGDVEVRQGSADQFAVDFIPFSRQPPDEQDQCADDFQSVHLELSATGNVVVNTFRDKGETQYLGADLIIYLPANFDSSLKINENNGHVNVNFVGGATGLNVFTDNGSCDITTGNVTALTVDCQNDVVIGVPSIPAGTGARTISARFGDIDASFPGGETFVVQAFAEDVLVEVGNAEGQGCTVEVAGEGYKTVACGGGTSADPLYQLTADAVTPEIYLSF
jgi:hypothetical protein